MVSVNSRWKVGKSSGFMSYQRRKEGRKPAWAMRGRAVGGGDVALGEVFLAWALNILLKMSYDPHMYILIRIGAIWYLKTIGH